MPQLLYYLGVDDGTILDLSVEDHGNISGDQLKLVIENKHNQVVTKPSPVHH